MRPSIIAQAWKNIAAKLHPQLPLSLRESQHLLNTLISSFRQHLDKEHPSTVDDFKQDKKHSSHDGLRVLHSSAALADKHLATVLTNPLLLRSEGPKERRVDAVAASEELAKDPGRDPVSLLEEYHGKGVATVAIAESCLRFLRARVQNLPKDVLSKECATFRAGGRTLHWLRNSGLTVEIDSVENTNFMGHLSYFLHREGMEQYLYAWLLADSQPTAAVAAASYWWKGRLLRAIIQDRLDHDRGGTADAAIVTFLEFCKIRAEATEPFIQQIPIFPALVAITRGLTKFEYPRTNSELYDKFCAVGEPLFHPSTALFRRAQLSVAHPSTPDPALALTFINKLENGSIGTKCSNPRTNIPRGPILGLLQRAIWLFRQQGNDHDALHLKAFVERQWPLSVMTVEKNIHKTAALRSLCEMPVTVKRQEKAQHANDEGMTFSTFAGT